jgi:hypothetical protein
LSPSTLPAMLRRCRVAALDMSASIALLVSAVYVIARLGCRRAILGAWLLNGELVAQLVLVPLAQTLALALWYRFRGKPV